MKMRTGRPPKQGLYDPRFEHDACGIGFAVDIKGRKSHEIVRQALTILINLSHRGGSGSEPNTGDGAGILLQIPDTFLRSACAAQHLHLPPAGKYAVGMVFLPPDDEEREACEETFEKIVKEEGQGFLGWRTVPTDDRKLGATARSTKPFIRQAFIWRNPDLQDDLSFERNLYVIRRRAEKAIRNARTKGGQWFYIASLSCKTMVYKGMLTAAQVGEFYLDLADPALASALALVHSRYSTNTFPSWERAHPYRYIIHNGEINTLRGNINWMYARQSTFESPFFGKDLEHVLPVIDTDGSDSAIFDNSLEFLVLAGRSLPHAVMMMIPEPWTNNETMSDEKKAFYEYHSCLMEPWDGPAAIAFTDGVQVGAVLDRNGLRPSRYYVTKDDLVIMASEAGVIDLPPDRVAYKGRLQPGRMLLIDTEEGRIIADDELKHKMAAAHPYRAWLNEYQVKLEDLPGAETAGPMAPEDLLRKQKAFGYSYEDLRLVIGPMARDAIDPVGAMGNDTPLAVLSEKPQLLYDYFKQLFAQVTNPPIDALREEIVTSTETMIGSEGKLLAPVPESCRQIKLQTPILTDGELAKLRAIDRPGFKPAVLPILFRPEQGEQGLVKAMDALCQAADERIREGANILILSDRDLGPAQAPIPALLAVSGLHHHLIREGTRTQVSLVLESGEPREVHHFALLLGYGVSAVNPYLAFASLKAGLIGGIDYEKAVKRYIKAATKGVLKVLSKMGISTIQGYQGAQIFEAVGLHNSIVERYFTWTPSRVGGVGLDVIAREACMRHAAAFAFEGGAAAEGALESRGQYQWRRDGEYHLYNPVSIHKLQQACRTEDYELYKEYARSINDQSQRLYTLRGLLKFKKDVNPLPLAEVESVESICRRFKTGAMSYGSISQEAHECLALAMNRLGGKSNSGEGGEDPARFKPEPNGDSRCSAIKQVASGRFGVTSEYLLSAQEIQIKIAQGAKPGEGGQLPGRKVYPWIARVRHATPGVGLISPPPHHDIYSIEDLAELIHDLKNANPQARISVKLVSEVGVGTIAAGVAKGRADVILISGYDGGTGASPRTSIRHAGLPWELGLAETHQTLLLNDLRSRVRLEADGKLMTGRDVAVAALLGAEEFGFATAPLVVLGCVMMRICNLDTCPVGVATQNPELRRRFAGDPRHVVNFMRFVAEEVREIMAELGFHTMDEMIGRVDRLEPAESGHWKTKGLDFSGILYQPAVPPNVGRRQLIHQDHGLEASLDRRVLLEICAPALDEKKPVRAILPIRNTDRVVGTMLGSEITRKYGAEGLPEDTIRLIFKGSAGQSFGAFIPRGVTLILEGDANDYLGKGLSGGKVIVYPPGGATFVPEENILVGNVALYGATGGEAYIRGIAGERFCVRNSGAHAVVEGVGDHGCEYMTGGRVVVLGTTGRNFAAGMSGGVAYVLDEKGDLARRCNLEMVELETLAEEEEIREVRDMIQRHLDYTGSNPAKKILARWEQSVPKIVKVMPKDYKRALKALTLMRQAGLSGDEATMAAFEENKGDMSRVSGN
ncbi:MAG: glutamate synthase large subunit [Bacteroidota bacterium]